MIVVGAVTDWDIWNSIQLLIMHNIFSEYFNCVNPFVAINISF